MTLFKVVCPHMHFAGEFRRKAVHYMHLFFILLSVLLELPQWHMKVFVDMRHYNYFYEMTTKANRKRHSEDSNAETTTDHNLTS